MMAASCQKELSDTNIINPSKELQDNGLLKVVFQAGTPEAKADFENSRITWKENDSLAVWDGIQVRKFVLLKGSENTFQGEVDPDAESHDVIPHKSKPNNSTSTDITNSSAPTVADIRAELKQFCEKHSIDTKRIISECGLNNESLYHDYVKAFSYAKEVLKKEGELPFKI